MENAELSREASDLRRIAYTSIRTEIADLVPDNSKTIVDVGCSNGALGKYLKLAQPGRAVFGVEFDPDFAKIASEKLDGVVCADFNTMKWQTAFPDQFFDCMIFADVLEHLVDPADCLARALERLKPGGSVVISLPNVRHISAFWSIFVLGRFPRRDRGLFDRTHLRWFTYSDAKDTLFASGLTIETETMSLRWRDQGGGYLNRLLNRMPRMLQRLSPVREILAYQFCFRCRAVEGNTSSPVSGKAI